MMRGATIAALAAMLCGCLTMDSADQRRPSDISEEVGRSERGAIETSNLARLAALEHGVNEFVQAEGRIPKTLDELIPKYLAEIPEAAGLRGHRDSARVKSYPATVIVDGQINGAAIQDSGGWGYAHNDMQVIVFVNCTHKNLAGQLWYQARGAF
ncbi:MAG TPA: hypothetical protein VNI01_02645 [Elusimicrobiota bacterium]|nr:hypothetical protein [Elusimicrobiota bacterium]